MIPRRIDREDGGDCYRALALYIADAGIGTIQGEKTLDSWYVGDETDDYLEGMAAVEAVQALNTRTKEPKTYHLMVSFTPRDEAKLSPQIYRDIELMLAEALGFSEHQRHCGVHGNTDNPHMHIAYNRIHPRSHTRHAPYYDYPKLHKACRAIEQKYGLVVANGMEPGWPKKDGLANAKVKSIEAHTGQESLFSYIMRHKPELMEKIEQAADWRTVHKAFLKYGLLLKPSGAGLTIKDRFGKHYAKPSQIDRGLSKGKLAERLGPFEEASPDLFNSIKPIKTYSAIPLHLGPERDNLYALFQKEMKRRKEVLEKIKEESSRRYSELKDRWNKKRQQLKPLPMMKNDRQRLELELKKREQEEIAAMRAEMAEARNKIRAAIPYTDWTKCLKHKAALGNETALAILRSKREIVQPERQQASIAPLPSRTIKWLDKKKKILEAHGLSGKHRQALLAVIKMQELMELEAGSGQPAQEFKYSIDTKGTIIFKLAGGGTIRDTGKEIHFSAHAGTAKRIAEKYARHRWGAMVEVGDSGIIKRTMPEQNSKKNKAFTK